MFGVLKNYRQNRWWRSGWELPETCVLEKNCEVKKLINKIQLLLYFVFKL